MCVLGMGKINAALGTMAILSDSRFDFSEAFIISTGCAGSSSGNTVMGDVFLIESVLPLGLLRMAIVIKSSPGGTRGSEPVGDDHEAL